ncbi:hypothetical protein [Nocardia sp. NPDC050710]|uniref:hypothetical protein n=1 Tax=Nocardia sp. NPDC050710 TaxID=3157220 RepID=UPI003402779A
MASAATQLLKEIEPLSAPDRRRAIATCALRLAGTPALGNLLAELSEADRYERIVAVQVAAVAGETDYLLGQLDSGAPEFAARAVVALIRSGIDPEGLIPRLPRMSHRTRRTMYRALGRGKRVRPADPLLPEIRQRFGDGEAARILPYCSAPVVAEYLPELAYAVPDRAALGRRHIETVLDYLEESATEAGEFEWPELWSWAGACAVPAAEHHPGRLLALAADAIRYISVHRLAPIAGRLARLDPGAVVDLILHPTGNGTGLAGQTLWTALRDLPDAQLIAVCTVYPDFQRRRFLRALPLPRRAAVVRAVFLRPGVGPAAVDATVLDLLPRHDRTTVARELLSRPGGSEIPEVRERLTARLPWDEAEPLLTTSIGLPSAPERSRAYPLLVAAAVGTRDPEIVGTLLTILRRLRNEQDPVRGVALQAVLAIPPTLLRTEHLPALEQVGTDALQARDRSYATTAAVGELARLLLVHGARAEEPAFSEAALRLMESLAAHATRPSLWNLHRNLPRGVEQRLFTALRRRLDNDASRDQWDLTLDLAEGLRRRAWTIPVLQRLLLRAIGAGNDSVVRRAVELALDNPATRDQHLSMALKRDRSLIALPRVQRLIATRRTDLLDSMLQSATSGRFIAPKVRFVPDFPAGFDGWTPRQVELYARLLVSLAESTKAALWERTWAVRRLGSLPGSFERLVGYTKHAELTVAEAALTALGRSELPEAACAVLTRHVDSDGARVAVSSIALCAKSIAPDRLATAVAPLLDSRKITSGKEGLRLLAELRAPEAMATLQDGWRRPEQHRDIRRAAVAACRGLLDRDAAWQLLADAAGDPEVAGEVVRYQPTLLPVVQRRRMASLIRDMAGSSDILLASQAISALPRWSRWSPPDTGALLVRRLCDLDELGLWRPLVHAVVSGVEATSDAEALLHAVDRLLATADLTRADRDLPARQRMDVLVSALGASAERSEATRTAALAVADRLATEPLWHRQAIDLYLSRIRWADGESTARSLRRACALATGALICHPTQHLKTTLPRVLRTAEAPTMLAIACDLADSNEVATTLAAVTVTAMCGEHFGWSPAWRALLDRLRAHDTIDIRAAASAIFTVAE